MLVPEVKEFPFLVQKLYAILKPLYNTNRSKKWGKNIQAATYNGARTVIVKEW